MWSLGTTKAEVGVSAFSDDDIKSPQGVMDHEHLHDGSPRECASHYIVPYLLKNSSEFRELYALRKKASVNQNTLLCLNLMLMTFQ